MWDERRPRHFTLSYTRFLYSPDVFHNEFVIILLYGRAILEEKEDESFYRR